MLKISRQQAVASCCDVILSGFELLDLVCSPDNGFTLKYASRAAEGKYPDLSSDPTDIWAAAAGLYVPDATGDDLPVGIDRKAVRPRSTHTRTP